MEIKTKFELGQEVFLMRSNRVANDSVDRMNIAIGPGPYGEGEYTISVFLRSDKATPMTESILFPSKEELIASL